MSLARVPSKQDAREAISYESYAAAATGLRRERFRFYSESAKDSRGRLNARRAKFSLEGRESELKGVEASVLMMMCGGYQPLQTKGN